MTGESTTNTRVPFSLDTQNIPVSPHPAQKFDSPTEKLVTRVTAIATKADDSRISDTNLLSSSDSIPCDTETLDALPDIPFILHFNGTDIDLERAIFTNLDGKKKYKPVARKIKPVIGELPDKFRIIRNIIGDPLRDLPISTNKAPTICAKRTIYPRTKRVIR